MPVSIGYLNRFRTAKQKTETLKDLADGKLDIVIGTHQLVNKNVVFKDLGLLIVDEEQKFGVNVKDKLKTIAANVDTLTLTATPIPRTLQFSLMAARDLSVITTPPPNRYPIETNVVSFSEELIRDAISYEIQRNGQVFFINNRIENIKEMAGMIQRLVPDARVGIGHGQMEGSKLEELMLAFMNGEFDVLVATTIIESGLDVPNANTIFITMAEHNELGKLGEKLAVEFLQKNGYKILETNWTFQKAEIDIIAQKANTLAVVEVKTRSSIDFGLPQDAVKSKKIQLLVKAVNEYVVFNDLDVAVRFDIIAIHKDANEFKIEHLEDAFYHF
jgi:uncharacterized protein (TIGR00252 family)